MARRQSMLPQQAHFPEHIALIYTEENNPGGKKEHQESDLNQESPRHMPGICNVYPGT